MVRKHPMIFSPRGRRRSHKQMALRVSKRIDVERVKWALLPELIHEGAVA
jgi:hypothetical protein